MKKIFYLACMCVIVMNACTTKTETVKPDLAAAKQELNSEMDKLIQGFNNRDTATFFAFLAEDGLFCGTDPTEILDRKRHTAAMITMFADTSMFSKIIVDKREIRMDSTANSAIVLEQFCFEFSKKLPFRQVYHMQKINGKWICDFSSMALTPYNKDFMAIFSAIP
ncbi:MAG TPA: nuclear transport factor 2 family protein [Bacteroidales bacterium]|nr:nuclear transport factor 2 family protein [Bacteroidales bacterium]